MHMQQVVVGQASPQPGGERGRQGKLAHRRHRRRVTGKKLNRNLLDVGPPFQGYIEQIGAVIIGRDYGRLDIEPAQGANHIQHGPAGAAAYVGNGGNNV